MSNPQDDPTWRIAMLTSACKQGLKCANGEVSSDLEKSITIEGLRDAIEKYGVREGELSAYLQKSEAN